jgi:hypothetical protein
MAELPGNFNETQTTAESPIEADVCGAHIYETLLTRS